MKLGDIEINANNEISGFRGKQVIIPIDEYEWMLQEIKSLNELANGKPCIRVCTEYSAYYLLYSDADAIDKINLLYQELEKIAEEINLAWPNKDRFNKILPDKNGMWNARRFFWKRFKHWNK